MIIINLRKFKILLGIVIISLFAFIIQIASNYKINNYEFSNYGKNKYKANIYRRNKNYITTTATPASEKTIIIDAGHGLPDERCRK